MEMEKNSENKFQSCIDQCNKSVQLCYECFEACLNEPNVKDRKNCISTLIQCAQMCQMSSAMMSMNSPFIKEHCKLCADICEKCAQECEMFEEEHCQRCAEECRKCAEECRSMSSM